MFNRIIEYINDDEFRLTVLENRIYIINYLKIISLDDDRISFLTKKGRVIIKGSKLSLNKMLDDEVLIGGVVSNIEVDFNE